MRGFGGFGLRVEGFRGVVVQGLGLHMVQRVPAVPAPRRGLARHSSPARVAYMPANRIAALVTSRPGVNPLNPKPWVNPPTEAVLQGAL